MKVITIDVNTYVQLERALGRHIRYIEVPSGYDGVSAKGILMEAGLIVFIPDFDRYDYGLEEVKND